MTDWEAYDVCSRHLYKATPPNMDTSQVEVFVSRPWWKQIVDNYAKLGFETQPRGENHFEFLGADLHVVDRDDFFCLAKRKV